MVLYSRPGDDINRGLVGFWKLDDLKRIPHDGIVAHYKMNDNAANTDVIDSKGGNTGTCSVNTSTISGVGKINEALVFTGSENVDLGTILNKNKGSISFWFKPTRLFNFNTLFDNSMDANKWEGWIYDDGRVSFKIINGVFITTPAGIAAIGTWLHVTFAWEENVTAKIYINGVLSIEDNSVPAVFDAPGTVYLAGGNAGNTKGEGTMDDVRFYDRLLSLSEVQTIYNSNSGTETTELFRDTIVAIDRANFNDGTISGATRTEGINGLNPDAMFFDGVDDNVTVDIISNINVTGTYSISFDVKIAGETASTYQQIFQNSSVSTDRVYCQYRRSDQTIRWTHDISGTRDSVSGAIDDDWNNIVLTSDNGVKLMYINGIIQSGISSPYSATQDNTKLYIGISSDNAYPLYGNLQNFRIYNRTLTAGEASKLHRLRK